MFVIEVNRYRLTRRRGGGKREREKEQPDNEKKTQAPPAKQNVLKLSKEYVFANATPKQYIYLLQISDIL